MADPTSNKLANTFETPEGMYRGHGPFDTSRFIQLNDLVDIHAPAIRASIAFVGRKVESDAATSIKGPTPSASRAPSAPPSPTASKKSKTKPKKDKKDDTLSQPITPLSLVPPISYPVFEDLIKSASASASTSPKVVGARHCIVNIRRHVVWYENERERNVDAVIHTNPKVFPSCHDLNRATIEPNFLEVVVGFESGEFVVRELYSQKETWFNKGSSYTDSPVTVVRWLPGSDRLLLVAFDDGSLFIFDKFRTQFQPHKISKDPSPFYITRAKSDDYNPVSQIHINNGQLPIFDAAFRDPEVVAIVGRDGTLRIVQLRQEHQTFAMSSFFGSLTCVSWSHDGKYIITGGQDDLVSIWSYEELDIVARAEGHKSWVTSVACDPQNSDSLRYRFTSVAQDAKLLLWDFTPSNITVPRATSAVIATSTDHQTSTLKRGKRKSKKPTRIEQAEGTVLPARARSDVPLLEPITVANLNEEPFTHVMVLDEGILTCAQDGEVRIWMRPVKSPATLV